MRKTAFIIWSAVLVSVCSAAPLTKIAFLGIEPVHISESAASGISEYLLNELLNTNRFTMVERDRITALLEEQGLSISGCTTTECYVQVGQLTGAEKVLVGKISKVESLYVLNVRIVDVYSGTIELSESEKSNSLDSLLAKTVNIAQSLAAKIPVTGTVISVTADAIKIDMGLQEGVTVGTDLVVFRYGEEYYHPDTGLLLGRDVDELGHVTVTKVLANELSEARLVGPFSPRVGDKVRLSEYEVVIETTPVVEPEVTPSVVEPEVKPPVVEYAWEEPRMTVSAAYVIGNAAYTDTFLADDGIKVSSGGPGFGIGVFIPVVGGFCMFMNSGMTMFTDTVDYSYEGTPVSLEVSGYLISALLEFQLYLNENPLKESFSFGAGFGVCYDYWTFHDNEATSYTATYDSWFGFEVNLIALFEDFMYLKLRVHMNTSTSHTWDIEGDEITIDHPGARPPGYVGFELGVLFDMIGM